MTSSSTYPRLLICEGRDCSVTVYDSCRDCNKEFCYNRIDIHNCWGRSQTTESSAGLFTFNIAPSGTPVVPKINLFFTPIAANTNPPPQTKAAFERHKKRAVGSDTTTFPVFGAVYTHLKNQSVFSRLSYFLSRRKSFSKK